MIKTRKGLAIVKSEDNNNLRGIDYEAAVALMDDDIREELHNEMAPCADEEFYEAYCEKHLEKYGEEFKVM